MSAASPPSSESRQAQTARVRRMRVARGACWVIVAAVVATSALALIDAVTELPGWVRGLALAFWVTGLGVLVWRLVVRPWNDLPESDETPLEARAELPGNLRAAAAAAIALATCLLAAAFVPGAVNHLRRVAIPWDGPGVSPYRVVVTSGEPIVARGGTVTLTAYAEGGDPAIPPPTTARFLFRTSPTSREASTTVVSDGKAAFHFTRAVATDFQYRVEVEGAASDWFTVTAIDPVALTNATRTELTPPQYMPDRSPVARKGFGPLKGRPHTTATFRFVFDRPAVHADLEFRAENGVVELTPVSLTADQNVGTATFSLRQNGTLRLFAVAERDGKKLRTAQGSAKVTIHPDTAPRFAQLTGVPPRFLATPPGEPVQISLVAQDDGGVASAELEWLALGETEPITIPIPLTNANTPQVGRHFTFDRAVNLPPGSTVQFRMRITDNRKLLPELHPQRTTYPETGWVTLVVNPNAPPIAAQEALGRRDVIRESLHTALQELEAASEHVSELSGDAARKPTLAFDEVARLQNARSNAQRAADGLQKAIAESRLNAELRTLAAALEAVISGYVRNAEVTLGDAATVPVADREFTLAQAGKYLADATARLHELRLRNDRLAQARLDLHELERIRVVELAIADQVEKLTEAELRLKQRELLDQFRALVRNSPALQEAFQDARRREYDRLAESATQLAGMIRDLNLATQSLHANAHKQLSAAIIELQQKLSDDAATLLNHLETPARLANLLLPKPDEFKRVSELVREGKTVEALTELARLAGELERVAKNFEKGSTDRVDAKVAARELAAWQDDLRKRFLTLTARKAANFPELPAETKVEFRREQAALRDAVKRLQIPPGQANKTHVAAITKLTEVLGCLDGIGLNADTAMIEASQLLKQLADEAPSLAERIGTAREQFDPLDREQRSIQVAVDQLLRNADPALLANKLEPLALRQRQVREAFSKIDLPGMDARLARTRAALFAAERDLAAALRSDIPASQAWVKREFARLRNILFDNTTPPDAKVAHLARRLAITADAVDALRAKVPDFAKWTWDVFAGTADKVAASHLAAPLEPHAASLRELSQELGKLRRPVEAAALFHDAREAVNAADLAFRHDTRLNTLARQLHTAATAVASLSDRLREAESDHERIKRLAANRRAAGARTSTTDAAVNQATSRQLGREYEELFHTRVGVGGQAMKKRALDEYARLRDLKEPARYVGSFRELGTQLDRLAAAMADVKELTAKFESQHPPSEPNPADEFLPSLRLAQELRSLAARYHAERERLSQLPAELARFTHPAKSNPLQSLAQQQQELAREVAAWFDRLGSRGVTIPTELYAVAATIQSASDHLQNGVLLEGKRNADRTAELLRALAQLPGAETAVGLAEKQEELAQSLSPLMAMPGVSAAQQHARAAELIKFSRELVDAVREAAQDAAWDEPTYTGLTEIVTTARPVVLHLTTAMEHLDRGRLQNAAAHWQEAVVELRGIAARISGVGPVSTTLSTLDPMTASLGDALREGDTAMQHALRHLETPQDLPSVAREAQVAASQLQKAIESVRKGFAIEQP